MSVPHTAKPAWARRQRRRTMDQPRSDPTCLAVNDTPSWFILKRSHLLTCFPLCALRSTASEEQASLFCAAGCQMGRRNAPRLPLKVSIVHDGRRERFIPCWTYCDLACLTAGDDLLLQPSLCSRRCRPSTSSARCPRTQQRPTSTAKRSRPLDRWSSFRIRVSLKACNWLTFPTPVSNTAREIL